MKTIYNNNDENNFNQELIQVATVIAHIKGVIASVYNTN